MQECFLTGRHNFLGLCMHFFKPFVLHAFFLTAKALQEFFSQIFHSSLKDQMIDTLEEPIKHLKRVGQPQCYGKDHIA